MHSTVLRTEQEEPGLVSVVGRQRKLHWPSPGYISPDWPFSQG